LIPAGTGLREYQKLEIEQKDDNQAGFTGIGL
jgi:hypothetical protein